VNPTPRLKIILTAAVATLALAVPSSASATIKLGAFNSGGPSVTSFASEFAADIGRQPEITMWYHDFGDSLLTSSEITALNASGQTPMVTWEPYNASLSSIAGGSYDSYIRSSAKAAKSYGKELMVRFAHEMNGTWYPWARSASYVPAWQRIVNIFREEGATNVKFVWAPNVDRTGSMPFTGYFPGESYVDYIGLDGYNFGDTSGNSWSTLESVFSASYAKITALSAKPLIITETASSEIGGSKAEWIRVGFLKTIPEKFPRVTGVIWFNKDQEDRWRIDSSQESLEAYREVANCTLYGGTVPCTAPTTTPPAEEPVAVEEVVVPPKVHGKKRRTKGRLSYRLSRDARVQITVQKRKGRGYVRRAGMSKISHSGRSRVPLRSLLAGKRLAPGPYRVTIEAKNLKGRGHSMRRAHFRIL
jgi:beta-mannanase